MDIKNKIKVICGKLDGQRKGNMFDVTDLEYVKADGYKTNNLFPTDGWQKFEKGQRLSGKDEHYWLRANFETPEIRPDQYLMLKITTGYEGKWDATNPQGLLYLNGKMVQGYDTNHIEGFLDANTKYVAHNYFYVGMIDSTVGFDVSVIKYNKRIEKLYYDMQTAYDTCLLLNENSDEYISIMTVLDRTAMLLDMREVYSDAYYKSIETALEFIEQELYCKLCSTEGKPIVNVLGHTHIDVEWRWTREQTREKIQRSFSTAKALMDKYPEYKFMLSQPELYSYLKEEAPEKYDELKELVKEGRWEPEGAMYLEADCNLVSGESFVRQIMQGKKFFKDEFQVDSKVLFLPDVFGYSAALPQILKKSGVEHFVTSKISWNDTNTMPVDSFYWEGIDGTEIFTNFITTQEYRGVEPQNYTTYVGKLTASQIKGTWNRYKQKEYTNRSLHVFGFGDGGGGPTKDMLERYDRLKKGLPGIPVAKMGFLKPHLDMVQRQFDENAEKLNRRPKWMGELYLEYHRGTYTSIGKNKKGNRRSEFALTKAEALSYIGLLMGKSYDADGLYYNWNKILHDQFHDIIPGSSIFEVYEQSDKDYAEVAEYCAEVVSEKLKAIAENIDTDGGILVYNPLGFARKGIITVEGKSFETEEIPAFGWKVINPSDFKSSVTVNGLTAENKYYKLTLDESGRIVSLFDKRADRDVIKPDMLGNELQVFEDFPFNYDNWEISDYYKQKMWILDDKADIEPILEGNRAGFSVTKKYFKSVIKQNIWLYSDNTRIDFDNDIDWHEQHQILKSAFPLDVHSMNTTYEIQFGHVTRPNHENTSWDKAKYEVYGHKWVDMSESGYGVALLNDCKYGHNTEGSILKITMLKCGTFPNPKADQGRHTFTYSLMPHIGDFREAGVIHEAYSLNQPLESIEITANEGKKPSEFSLVSCDKENVIVETVKKCEYDNGMIVRMYDAFDSRTKVTLTVADGFKKAYLCDLMENVIADLPFDGKTVTLHVKNFEIVTLKFI